MLSTMEAKIRTRSMVDCRENIRHGHFIVNSSPPGWYMVLIISHFNDYPFNLSDSVENILSASIQFTLQANMTSAAAQQYLDIHIQDDLKYDIRIENAQVEGYFPSMLLNHG